MTHKVRHKQIRNVKKKYKNLAGIVAAAAILSTAALPGMPSTIAHASASANGNNMSATTSQQIGKTDQSGLQINFNSINSPVEKVSPASKQVQPNNNDKQASAAIQKATKEAKQKTAAPKPAEQTKQETATPKPAEQTKQETAAPKPAKQTKQETAAPKPAEQTKQETAAPKPAEQTKQETPAPKPAEQTKQETAAPKPAEQTTKTSPGTPPANYKEVLDIKATAYAPGAHDNGKWGNLTHIGSQVRPGVIAVDPDVIPLGSRVYIQYPDGRGEYAVAEDTGGAIKGNRVDIAKWTVNEAKDFGIQKVKVFVVSTPEKV